MPCGDAGSKLRDRMSTRVVIAGGGVAALEALLALQADAGDLIDVTLVADSDAFSYRALQLGRSSPERYPLAALVEGVGARFVRGSVASIGAGARELVLDGGRRIPYGALLLATGARTSTFPGDHALDAATTIVVPPGVLWSLPAYELALRTGARVVTHEARPLDIFGLEAARVVADTLRRAGVAVQSGVAAAVPAAPGVISLPVPRGPRVHGLPSTADGYLDCDQHGRVRTIRAVWAAGDGTAQPIKQGGLAAQQADAAAADIARIAGASNRPRPFRPVLRGLLQTPEGPLYLRRALAADDGGATVSDEPLWWPPSKVASRRLGAHLTRLDVAAGLAENPQRAPRAARMSLLRPAPTVGA
jgi:sulfide:quinone oxidoreductase